MAGIVGYGAYIPRNRIKVEEIAKVWGADAPSYKKGLMLEEKSVPSPDQDTITMSVEAARQRPRAGRDRSRARSARSTSARNRTPTRSSRPARSSPRRSARRPTSTRPTSSSPARPAREGMFVALALVKAGADGVRPGRRRGHLAGRAGRRARVLGGRRRRGLPLRARRTSSPSAWRPTPTRTDTPDFWRREYQFYPRHGGRFTGEPAYFKHVLGRGQRDPVEKSGMKPADFAVRRLPPAERQVPACAPAQMLGFTQEQIEPGWLVPDARQHLLGRLAASA